MKGNAGQYNFSNKIYMFFCLIRTKLFYPKARLIRFPFDIRNGKQIQWDENFTTGRLCRIEVINDKDSDKSQKKIFIGKNVRMGDFIHISAYDSIKIGNNVGIGPKTVITDVSHGNFAENEIYDIDIEYAERPLMGKSVEIGNNVWIGESVSILPGVTIGDGCIIGAMTNVVRSIPPYSIAVGNPAKVVKKYNFETRCWERVKK